MDRHSLLVGGGCAITAFALVAAVIIEVLQTEIVVGILGVLAGVITAALIFTAVAIELHRFRPRSRWVAEGAAGTGYTLAVFGAVTYVDGPVLGSLGTLVVVAISLIVGVVVGLRSWRRQRVTRR